MVVRYCVRGVFQANLTAIQNTTHNRVAYNRFVRFRMSNLLLHTSTSPSLPITSFIASIILTYWSHKFFLESRMFLLNFWWFQFFFGSLFCGITCFCFNEMVHNFFTYHWIHSAVNSFQSKTVILFNFQIQRKYSNQLLTTRFAIFLLVVFFCMWLCRVLSTYWATMGFLHPLPSNSHRIFQIKVFFFKLFETEIFITCILCSKLALLLLLLVNEQSKNIFLYQKH